MGWSYKNSQVRLPVVKQNGLCRRNGMHKYCPYFVAKHSATELRNNRILGYRCTLFDADKTGYEAVEACNEEYGLDYDGLPNPY
jgi:hypothetical protein